MSSEQSEDIAASYLAYLSTENPYQQGANEQRASGGYHQSELIALCLKKDRKAQKDLYNQYAPFIYGVIRRYMYNEAAAKEILNDTFYKVFTKLESFSSEGSFEGWMRRIAVNTITDYLRKNMKHDQLPRVDTEFVEIKVKADAASLLEYKELLKMVHELPETQRAVFNLFVFEQFAHKDIAQMLNLTENNCRWYLNDARKRLKNRINNVM